MPTKILILVCVLMLFGCGPGWEGYEDNYSEVGPVSEAPWAGDESVFVVLDDTKVEVFLESMTTYDYQGAPAVSLSELIIKSAVTPNPETYRYDFTATDNYNLLIKRRGDLRLLPSWQEMLNGYLYLDPRYDDLTCGWSQHPWGSAVSAYWVKWMNGGTITLLVEQ